MSRSSTSYGSYKLPVHQRTTNRNAAPRGQAVPAARQGRTGGSALAVQQQHFAAYPAARQSSRPHYPVNHLGYVAQQQPAQQPQLQPLQQQQQQQRRPPPPYANGTAATAAAAAPLAASNAAASAATNAAEKNGHGLVRAQQTVGGNIGIAAGSSASAPLAGTAQTNGASIVADPPTSSTAATAAHAHAHAATSSTLAASSATLHLQFEPSDQMKKKLETMQLNYKKVHDVGDKVIAMNMASIKLAVEDGSVLAVENACTYHAVRKWLVGFIDEINSSEITSEICTPMSL